MTKKKIKKKMKKKKNDTNRIIRIINDEEFISTDNNKNSLGLIEDKKEEEKVNTVKNNNSKENKKYVPLSAEMIMKNLLSRKRYNDNSNNSNENINEQIDEKNKSNNEQKKSIEEYFNQKNNNNSRNNKIQDKDSSNMLFKDKPIKLIENKNNNVINYDLGTIRVMINFENPIIADFSFFGPKNTDFFKKYDILKFQSLDILDTIDADLNNDIYGYLVNGNFNRGHLILASYLNFYEKRVYFYRNDNLGICIYIFGKGKLKNSILQKCGRKIEESKNMLTFLIKTGINK